jgi:hypothetical protein
MYLQFAVFFTPQPSFAYFENEIKKRKRGGSERERERESLKTLTREEARIVALNAHSMVK